jgi:hypothetical protein
MFLVPACHIFVANSSFPWTPQCGSPSLNVPTVLVHVMEVALCHNPQCSTSINLWCLVRRNSHRAVLQLTCRRRTCAETLLFSGCAFLFDSFQVRISAAYCLVWQTSFIVSRPPTINTATRRERRLAILLRSVDWDRTQDLSQLTSMDRHRHSVLQPNILCILFVGFARISYWRFIAIRCRFKRPTCIQEPLVIGRRGWVQRDLNGKTVSSR